MRKMLTLLVITLTLAGCAHHYDPEVINDPYGLFSGLWHGYIFIFSIIGSIFSDNIFIIGRPNTGLFYYIGYVLGLLGFLGSVND